MTNHRNRYSTIFTEFVLRRRFSLGLFGFFCLLGLSGCGSSERFQPVTEVPPAALITESDIENLLRITVELRQDVYELQREVEALKANQ